MTPSLVEAIREQWGPSVALCALQIVVGFGGFITYRGHAVAGGMRSRLVPVPAAAWGWGQTALALLQYGLIAAGTVVVLAAGLPPLGWVRGLLWVPLIVYFAMVGMMNAVLFPTTLLGGLWRLVTPLALALAVHLAAGGSASEVIWSELVYAGIYFTTIIPVMLIVLFATVGRHAVSGGFLVINVLLFGGLLVMAGVVGVRVLPEALGRDPVAWLVFLTSAAAMAIQYVRAWHRTIRPLVAAGKTR